MPSDLLGADVPDISRIEMICTEWQSDGAFEAAAHRAAAEYLIDEDDNALVGEAGSELVNGPACDPFAMDALAPCSQIPATSLLAPSLPQDLSQLSTQMPAGPNAKSEDTLPSTSSLDHDTQFGPKKLPPALRKQQGKLRRRRQSRQMQAKLKESQPLGYAQGFKPKPSTLKKYHKLLRIPVAISAKQLPHSSGSAWIGKRTQTPDWDDVKAEGVHCLAQVRSVAVSSGAVQPKELKHRRGHFLALPVGVSHGGGQERPTNLYQGLHARRILSQSILQNRAIYRIAGYQSAAFAFAFPKLYRYYESTLARLFAAQPELEQNFDHSIFPEASFNCGPHSVSLEHYDSGNLSFGPCALTPLGQFDYTQGGHLVLHEPKIVAEFPPGTTALIPSAAIKHSNTPIQDGEDRYSIAQYAAGGLFRWVEYGFKNGKHLLATSAGRIIKLAADKPDGERWKDGITMYSTIDSFIADQIPGTIPKNKNLS
ncbi:hypothetical protein EST38_g14249 [Candolleomyces aberdarensis]|uniref:Uncharacterized protein n=1 Tax=Candolleomyces aberdarensis TaxID=2316362 RepID=A0A4Q2CZL0_9AGAR|nr:hypothetical protein EST38_g14249 [Candolleomyces aberdarensis]